MSKPNFHILQIVPRDGESLQDAIKRSISENIDSMVENAVPAPDISFSSEGKIVINAPSVQVEGQIDQVNITQPCEVADHLEKLHEIFHEIDQSAHHLRGQLAFSEAETKSLEDQLKATMRERNQFRDELVATKELVDKTGIENARQRAVELGLITSDRNKLLDDINQLMKRKETLQGHVHSLQITVGELLSRGESIRAILLTPAEIQSGSSRVKWAEGLIRQLPETHEGRNSWLMNYAKGKNGYSLEDHIHRAGAVDGAATSAPNISVSISAKPTMRMAWVIERGCSDTKTFPDYLKRDGAVYAGPDSMYTKALSEALHLDSEEEAKKVIKDVRLLSGDSLPIEAYFRAVPNE